MNCAAVRSARRSWEGCCAWVAISAVAASFKSSVIVRGKLFPVLCSSVLWAAPPQPELLNHPRRLHYDCPPHGGVSTARGASRHPHGWRPITRGGGWGDKALLGFAYELPLTAVHAAGLIAGSLYILQSCCSCEDKITSNNLFYSRAPRWLF